MLTVKFFYSYGDTKVVKINGQGFKKRGSDKDRLEGSIKKTPQCYWLGMKKVD